MKKVTDFIIFGLRKASNESKEKAQSVRKVSRSNSVQV